MLLIVKTAAVLIKQRSEAVNAVRETEFQIVPLQLAHNGVKLRSVLGQFKSQPREYVRAVKHYKKRLLLGNCVGVTAG